MTKTLIAAALAAALAGPACAQVVESPTGTVVVPPGAPGVVTPQSGSTGNSPVINYTPTGRAEDVISTESAAAGNANQPSRAAPQGGGGGK